MKGRERTEILEVAAAAAARRRGEIVTTKCSECGRLVSPRAKWHTCNLTKRTFTNTVLISASRPEHRPYGEDWH